MAQKKSIIDMLADMSKGKVIAISIIAMIAIGFPLVYFGFGFNQKPKEEVSGPVLLDVPDATAEDYDKSRMQTYRDAELAEQYNRSGDSYWDSLGDDLVSNSNRNVDLDPNIYSPLEIYEIRNGKKTKEEIDAQHAADAARKAQLDAIRGSGPSAYSSDSYQNQSLQRPMTQAQKDSAYFSRLDKAYSLAMKYSAQASVPDEPEAEEIESEKEPERKIEIDTPSSLPTEAMSSDGIITSLVDDSESGVVHYAGTANSKPVKATFLKNETINDGQRVIIRLMQDMTLTDGTTIPANTHITGICSFGSRLKINVKMLHYNGRMFPTDISVYDNDGTEGIYCPTIETSKKKARQAKQVAQGVAGATGGVLGTVLGSSPFMGRIASQGMSTATSFINDDGSVSVRVLAGYEFYVFENKKEEKAYPTSW